ncbi:hypothetical protein [Dehalobacter sp. 4CP]|nr:hypothetical protein [Dehalobacter sp.]
MSDGPKMNRRKPALTTTVLGAVGVLKAPGKVASAASSSVQYAPAVKVG